MKMTTKKILSSTLIWFAFSIIIVLVCTSLFKFNIVSGNPKSFSLYSFFSSILIFLFLGFVSGNIHNKKGIFIGLAYALIVLSIVHIFMFLAYNQFFLGKNFIKVIIQITASMLGGILGVNFKPIIK